MVYRISVDEYERMAEAGVLDDPRVELIDGLLVKKMGKKPPHEIVTHLLFGLLGRIVPPGWHIRKEAPVRIPPRNEPEPDLAIVAGSLTDYWTRHPGPDEIALVVEVAESSLDRDQGIKLAAYAAGGIRVYWIANLVDRRVEVYSQPSPQGYQTRQNYITGQTIPVVVAGVECGQIAVSDILP
jgi:Uma2 family endonuclease